MFSHIFGDSVGKILLPTSIAIELATRRNCNNEEEFTFTVNVNVYYRYNETNINGTNVTTKYSDQFGITLHK